MHKNFKNSNFQRFIFSSTSSMAQKEFISLKIVCFWVLIACFYVLRTSRYLNIVFHNFCYLFFCVFTAHIFKLKLYDRVLILENFTFSQVPLRAGPWKIPWIFSDVYYLYFLRVLCISIHGIEISGPTRPHHSEMDENPATWRGWITQSPSRPRFRGWFETRARTRTSGHPKQPKTHVLQ